MSSLLRHTYLILCIVLAGALIVSSGCVSESEPETTDVAGTVELSNLTFYTEELPPYNYEENGTVTGISVDLLEEATGKMGSKISGDDVQLVSWTEGYQAVLTENNTVLFSMIRTTEREELFKWAGPIYENKKVLLARTDSGISVENAQELNNYQIGVISDDVAIQYLEELGVNQSQIVTKSDVYSLIDALDNEEIDLWASPEASGKYFAEQATGSSENYTVVYQLKTEDAYFAFSKDVPDSLVESFQQAIDEVREEENEEENN